MAEAPPDRLCALPLCSVVTHAPLIRWSHRPGAGLTICSPSTVPPRAQHTVGPQQKSAERTNQPGFCGDIRQNTGGYLRRLLSTTQVFLKYFCFIYQKIKAVSSAVIHLNWLIKAQGRKWCFVAIKQKPWEDLEILRSLVRLLQMGFLFIARPSSSYFIISGGFLHCLPLGFLILLYKVISVMGITRCLFLLVWEAGLLRRESWPGGLDADVAAPHATGGGQRLSPGPGAHKVTNSPLRLPPPPFPTPASPLLPQGLCTGLSRFLDISAVPRYPRGWLPPSCLPWWKCQF